MAEPTIAALETLLCGCATGRPPATLTPRVSICGPESGGPCVLCLPAGPGFGHQIIRAIGHVLSGVARPLLVDYPGHSATAEPPAGWKALVAELGRAAEAAGDPVLLGHSWGADVALSVAVRRSPAALILLSPPPAVARAAGWTRASGELRRKVSGGVAPADWFRQYLVDFALPLGMADDRERAARLLDGVPTFDRPWRTLRREADPSPLSQRLKTVNVPTLIVVGGDDALLDSADLEQAASLAYVEISVLDGGHYIYLDAPAELRAVVGAFLSRQAIAPARRSGPDHV